MHFAWWPLCALEGQPILSGLEGNQWRSKNQRSFQAWWWLAPGIPGLERLEQEDYHELVPSFSFPTPSCFSPLYVRHSKGNKERGEQREGAMVSKPLWFLGGPFLTFSKFEVFFKNLLLMSFVGSKIIYFFKKSHIWRRNNGRFPWKTVSCFTPDTWGKVRSRLGRDHPEVELAIF